jgi:uncharacterized membrane protein HdeD (DUF308 family)
VNWIELNWKILVTQGVVGIVFGIVAMVWPIASVITLVVAGFVLRSAVNKAAVAGTAGASGALASATPALGV